MRVLTNPNPNLSPNPNQEGPATKSPPLSFPSPCTPASHDGVLVATEASSPMCGAAPMSSTHAVRTGAADLCCVQLGLMQGVQHAGDTVYVPPGWLHGVINLSTTLAVTENVILRQQPPYVQEEESD